MGWNEMTSGYMLIVLTIAFMIFIWALADMLQAKRENEWKILWLLVLVMVPVIGFFLYLLIGRQERNRKKR